jgi:hypothetical protein
MLRASAPGNLRHIKFSARSAREGLDAFFKLAAQALQLLDVGDQFLPDLLLS